MPRTPSPLRYPGGKTVYASMISEIIQENNLSGCSYAEPFAGGAGAAITLLLNNQVKDIWLNDFDYSIYAFWYSILKRTDEFIQKIIFTPITISEWKKQKAIYTNKSVKKDILSIGFATFYLNRCNRAGILLANPIGGINQTGKDQIDARFKKEVLISKIKKIAQQKSRIHLFNLDAIDFIDVIKKETSKIMVYFDPPYYKKGELLYLNFYRHNDHKKLSKKIINSKLTWLLSYDDHPEIVDLYNKFPVYKRRLHYSVSNSSWAQELIISNLNIPKNLRGQNAS